MNEFDMIISKKWIMIIWELKFSETFKNLEIYLNFINWLYQYIFYYAQLIKSLQNKKMTLLHKNFTAEKSQKKYFKKTWINKSFVLEYETFESIQKFLINSTFFIIKIQIADYMLILISQNSLNSVL